MRDSSPTRQLLLQLLNDKSPELGARLKQRLNDAFADSGLGRFDEKAYGYQRFSEFLQRAFGDIVSIERQGEVGDILVSLRSQQYMPSPPSPRTPKPPILQLPRVRNDVWQAFSNPDSQRKRFLNKKTGAIRHFLQTESSVAKTEVEASPDDFVEIKPIEGLTQYKWMGEFLDRIQSPPKERSTIEALINQPYSSNVNAMFTRALGEQGDGWRQYRSSQIVSLIRSWAKGNEIPFDTLEVQARQDRLQPTLLTPDSSTSLSPRQQAIKLLEILDDDDIARLVIPTLLTSILVKSRR